MSPDRFSEFFEEQIDELKDGLLELKDEMQTNHSKLGGWSPG